MTITISIHWLSASNAAVEIAVVWWKMQQNLLWKVCAIWDQLTTPSLQSITSLSLLLLHLLRTVPFIWHTRLYISLITTPIHFHQLQIFGLLYCHHQTRCCNSSIKYSFEYESIPHSFEVTEITSQPVSIDLPNRSSLIRIIVEENKEKTDWFCTPKLRIQVTRFTRAKYLSPAFDLLESSHRRFFTLQDLGLELSIIARRSTRFVLTPGSTNSTRTWIILNRCTLYLTQPRVHTYPSVSSARLVSESSIAGHSVITIFVHAGAVFWKRHSRHRHLV